MNCIPDIQTLQRLIQAIESSPPRPHHHAMLAATSDVLAECTFQHVLSKGGWYRAGGVLSVEGNHRSHNLEAWVNTELAKCGDDFEQFMAQYVDAGLMVTRHMGRTHYFVAPYGPAPEDFLQLEVEELQETLDRQLIDPTQPPYDRTELVEPISYAKVDAHPVARPRYRFARLVDIRELLARQSATSGKRSPLARFLSDWSQSRAAEHDRFCERWLIANLDHYDPNGTTGYTVALMSAHARALAPFQWDVGNAGVALGNQIRDFDRAAGYPGAWYFHIVASKLVPDVLTNTIKQDLDNGYQYLADKDLGLLQRLMSDPYRVGAVS